jgi:glycosyltransferase involved in cell wall biosynthesis
MPAGVSCLCLTYGRPFLLEEAVESFLRQTWNGSRELIILNDHPDQELVFDHRDIVVVNKKQRLRSLGEKRNLSVALARYEHLLPWDDDDIHLPSRIEETTRELKGRHFFKMSPGVANESRRFGRSGSRGRFCVSCACRTLAPSSN